MTLALTWSCRAGVLLWLQVTFDGLLQVLQVELVLTDQTFFKLSELLSLLLHLEHQKTTNPSK